ncbi:hypothetical protein M4D79_25565 [Mycolicibacterium novocastrense]|nr:hypothetical protein M4D79_25565 [Mycolicibacterium novocastrense]
MATRNVAPDIARARARAAGLSAFRKPNAPDLIEAKRTLREAVLAKHIRGLVDTAPPLTQEQRDRLAELLRPVRKAGAA